MAISLNDNLQIQAGKHVDDKYGPYNDLSSALSAIPSFKRVRGLTIGIIQSGSLKEYWFKDGTADANLVEKTATPTPDISDTYSNIRSLANQSKLIPGKYYRITDFKTAWWDWTLNGYVGQPISVANIQSVISNGVFVSPSGTSDPMNGKTIRSSRFAIIESGDTNWQSLGAASSQGLPNNEFVYNGTAPVFKNNAPTGTHGKVVPCIFSDEIVSTVTEPLIVLATTVNKFQSIAHSELYPGDTIEYDFFEQKSWSRPGYGFWQLQNGRGWITRRKGMVWGGAEKLGQNNTPILDSKGNQINDPIRSQGIYDRGTLDCPYDWRHITWPCRKLDSSKIEEWSSTKGYNKGDIVRLKDVVYICINAYAAGGSYKPAVDANNNYIASGSGSLNDRWLAVSLADTYIPTHHSADSTATGLYVYMPGKNPHLLPNTETPWSYWGTSSVGVQKYTQFYGRTRMAFNPNIYSFFGTSYFLPWDFTTRAQKLTLSTNPDVADTNPADHSLGGGSIINGYGNVVYATFSNCSIGTTTDGGCDFNVFRWGTMSLKTGATFARNIVGYVSKFKVGSRNYGNNFMSLKNGVFGDEVYNNSLSIEDCTGGDYILYNLLGGGVANNSFGNYFIENLGYFQFLYNTFIANNISNTFESRYVRENKFGYNNFNNSVKQVQRCTFESTHNLSSINIYDCNFKNVQSAIFTENINGSNIADSTNIYLGNIIDVDIKKCNYLEGGRWAYCKISNQSRLRTTQNTAYYFQSNIMETTLSNSYSVEMNFSNASLCYNSVPKSYALLGTNKVSVTYPKFVGAGSTPADCTLQTEGLKNSAGNWDMYNPVN
jgi:hypothetical protein